MSARRGGVMGRKRTRGTRQRTMPEWQWCPNGQLHYRGVVVARIIPDVDGNGHTFRVVHAGIASEPGSWRDCVVIAERLTGRSRSEAA